LLSNIVIGFDIVIIIWFLLHTYLQGRWIKRETKTAQALRVDMTDFAVRIKKLPKIQSLEELEEFTQALQLHIESIVAREESVFDDPQKVKPEEVVSIDFAFTSFGGYNILFNIEKLVQEGQRLRTKHSAEKDPSKKAIVEEKIYGIKDKIIA